MRGCEDENYRRRIPRHMWQVPSRGSATAVAVGSGSPPNYFVKDGRHIKIGDCALFKPPHESPPFIGVIHQLTSYRKESDLKLVVNWLYRPSEVELNKGVAVEAAPNEVFYSFHRDETPAASLLHCCKVAFLPKGVELPSGVSSFVCRRVYDITNKRLRWLTDKDFRNDHQEEIDKLLQRTHLEMHATVQQQQGTPSPKTVNGANATSPLKHSPDSMQNSSSSYPLPSKGKKRELSDQTSEPVKRERLLKSEDGDSTLLRSDSTLKSEIAKITDRGGLVESEAVERLVHLMLSEKSQKKIDFSSRSMLAGIISATERIDCLNQFVQSKGLPVLGEWIQEAHKGKVGDSTSPKDSDKSVDEFLLVLLRALDKLPVDLHALQMSNIGKSVNHLRTHKNLDIQKKARSLVDTWKKRVEAEISNHEAKPASNQAVAWSSKSRHDATHGGNRHNNSSSDPVMRSTLQVTSTRSSSVKPVHGEASLRSTSVGAQKISSLPASMAANDKEVSAKISFAGNGCSEPLHTIPKEEKSSSSSQSHTNSQCSSDHAKNIAPSGKEDARTSTAGSKSVSKLSASRHRKSANGLLGTTSSAQKETGTNRSSSLTKVSASEKSSNFTLSSETTFSAPVGESNSHKIIVKIPNRGRSSPGQGANPGSAEDPSSKTSRASSPVHSEKHDQAVDGNSRGKTSPLQTNNKVDGLPVVLAEVKQNRNGDDTARPPDFSKGASLSSVKESKSKRAAESSLNVLIESCAYSEAHVSTAPVGDDSGMNLLASVAAGEISRSCVASPVVSPARVAATPDNPSTDHEGTKQSNGEPSSIRPSSIHDEDLQQKEDPSSRTSEKLDELAGIVSVFTSPMCVSGENNDGRDQIINADLSMAKEENHDSISDQRQETSSSLPVQDSVMVEAPSSEGLGGDQENLQSCSSFKCDDGQNNGDQGLHHTVSTGKFPHLPANFESDKQRVQNEDSSGTKILGSDIPAKEDGNTNERESCNHMVEEETRRTKQENAASSSSEKKDESGISEQEFVCKNEDMEKEAHLIRSGGSSSEMAASAFEEVGPPSSSKNSVIAVAEGEKVDECVKGGATVHSSSATRVSDFEKKLEFDLNEGFNLDDMKTSEPVTLATPQLPSSVPSPSPPPASVSSMSGSLPASVTVAAAAKRPFVPPDDLLRNKAELGWKGSAATSAFRPAEPRKGSETPTISNKPHPSNESKSARPVFDFDLNVTDEMFSQDMGCQSSAQNNDPKPDRRSGGLVLDLNCVDDPPEPSQHPLSSVQKFEIPSLPMKPLPFSRPLNNEVSAKRDFDLNDGPATDESTVESSSVFNSNARFNIPPQAPSGLRISNTATSGSLSSWYSPGIIYSAVTTPSALPDSSRVDHHQPFPVIGTGGGPPPQRMLGGPPSTSAGGPPSTSAFNPEFYRGPVLMSSPAMPFASSSFQYPVFPFGTSFPLPTTSLPGGSTAYVDPLSGGRFCAPAIPTQLVGTSASVSSQYLRPCVVSLPDISGNSVESSRKWGRAGLDLNSGPVGGDADGRDEALLMASRQLPSMGAQPLAAEDQTRTFQMTGGGVLKRKEPEGGWDTERMIYKQPSWQ